MAQQFQHELVILKKTGQDSKPIAIPELQEVTFGRAEGCNIRIQKNSVSIQHARIYYDANKLPMIENLSKTNFTTLNGTILSRPVHLHNGDTICIADRFIRFNSTQPVPDTRTPLKLKSNATPQISAPSAPVSDENAAPNKPVVSQPTTSATTISTARSAAVVDSTAATAKEAAKLRERSNSLSKVELKPHSIDEPAPSLTTVTGTVATPHRKQKRKLAETPKGPLAVMPAQLQTSIVERAASQSKAVFSKPAPMATPMRKSIVAKAKSRPAQPELKSLATPVKKSIKRAGGKSNPMFDKPEHVLETPMKKQIAAKGAEPNSVFVAREHAMDTPMRSELVTKASHVDRAVFSKPAHVMPTPMKRQVVAAGDKPSTVFVPPEHTMDSPMRSELIGAAENKDRTMFAAKPTLETPVKRSIAGAVDTRTARIAANEAAAAASAEKAKLAAVAAAVQAVEQAEGEDDDDDEVKEDEENAVDDDDDIQVNMPSAAAPSEAGMKTPTRKGTPNSRARVMYVNEHATGTPMRDALIAAATPIAQPPVSAMREVVRRLPTPVKKELVPAAFDMMALRRVAAAQNAIIADNAAEARGEKPEPEAQQQFKLFTVDVESAGNAIEQHLAALEEKMGGKCTKSQLEDAAHSAIDQIRIVIGKLNNAGATVTADVIEKCIAINAVNEERVAQEQQNALVESQPMFDEHAAPIVDSVDANEKPKGRGRARKSISAAAATTTTTTTPKGRRAPRKSMAQVDEAEPDDAAATEEKAEPGARRRSRTARK